MQYIYLIIGFVLLVKGADYFVEGSSNLAKILKISSAIIGLTVVAFGTSLPEASVSTVAALKGNSGIALGNVIGSNIFNLFMILGTCALFTKLVIDKNLLYRDFIFSLLLSILSLIFIYTNKVLSNIEGLTLLIIFFIYIAYTIKIAMKNRQNISETEDKKISLVLSIIYVIGGIISIIWGGKLVVSSASNIAIQFGLSDTLVGLTIVAIGTSLPELVTSFIATKKGENEIAIGNVIGSNIFNIGFILSSSSTIKAIQSATTSVYDLSFFILGCILFIIFVIFSGGIKRLHGFIYILLYTGYTIYIILR